MKKKKTGHIKIKLRLKQNKTKLKKQKVLGIREYNYET